MVARRGDPAELADLIAACGPGVSRCTSANSLPCAAWLVAGGNERERSTKGRWCRQSKCPGGGENPCGPVEKFVKIGPQTLVFTVLPLTPHFIGTDDLIVSFTGSGKFTSDQCLQS